MITILWQATSRYRSFLASDATWDFRTLDVAKHLDQARTADDGVVSATSADITPFVSRGGKLVIYHG